MALKEPFLVKTVLGKDTPELKADAGEAFLVKDIMVRDSVSDYITVRIEKATVGYFRMKGPYGGHVAFRRGHAQHSHTVRVDGGSGVSADYHFPLRDAAGRDRSLLLGFSGTLPGDVYDEVQTLMWSGWHLNPTILKYLEGLGIFKGFPIAEGETLTIAGMGGDNSITLIIYEQYDPEDIVATQENGSKSLEYLFLNYGTTGANITTATDTLFDTPVSPAEFPDFPFGRVVPPKHEVDILGVCGSPRAPGENDGTDYIYTKFLKLVKDREVLFDEDRNGILFMQRSPTVDSQIDQTAEGFTLIGNLSEYDNNPPLMFPQGLKFIAGDELNIYLTTEAGGDGQILEPSEQEIAIIQKVRRLE